MKRWIASGVVAAAMLAWLAAAGGALRASAADGANADGGLLRIFYIGNRHSELEPCGCKTKQRGGIQYEATLYQMHEDVPAIRVDAGDWTKPQIQSSPLEAMKTRYLLHAFNHLDLDAVNVGLDDVQLSIEYFESVREEYPDALERLISANVFLLKQPEQHAFPTHRIVTRKLPDGREIKVGIIGATALNASAMANLARGVGGLPTESVRELNTSSFIVRDPEPYLRSVIDQLRPQVDLLVLLYTGDNDQTIKLAEDFDGVDFIITTANLTPEAAQGVFNNTRLLGVKNVSGRELGMATLRRGEDGAWQPAQPSESLAVSVDLAANADMLAIIEAFKEKTKNLNQQRPEPPKERIYAGARRCQTCHAEQFKDWQSTPHAHAIATLSNKNQAFNPECLKCHTTGFQHANGFFSHNDPYSKQMGDVQCEVCHGPSKAHADLEMKIKSGSIKYVKDNDQIKAIMEQAKAALPPKTVPADVCLKCHTPENDDHFVYDEKIVKVNHSGFYLKDKPADVAASGDAAAAHGSSAQSPSQPDTQPATETKAY